MRAVVIHHQMNFQIGGHAGLDSAQELQEFTAAMATVQFTNDFASGNVQRGKQGGGAVAHIVVSTALGNARRQRQYGLRTIEGLDLALLVNTQHHRLEWRIEVQADDVANLVDEQRIARKFEVSCRCGCRPKARQIRDTAVCERLVSRAIVSVLQCVAPAGRDSSVFAITASTCAFLDRSGCTRTRCVE